MTIEYTTEERKEFTWALEANQISHVVTNTRDEHFGWGETSTGYVFLRRPLYFKTRAAAEKYMVLDAAFEAALKFDAAVNSARKGTLTLGETCNLDAEQMRTLARQATGKLKKVMGVYR